MTVSTGGLFTSSSSPLAVVTAAFSTTSRPGAHLHVFHSQHGNKYLVTRDSASPRLHRALQRRRCASSRRGFPLPEKPDVLPLIQPLIRGESSIACLPSRLTSAAIRGGREGQDERKLGLSPFTARLKWSKRWREDESSAVGGLSRSGENVSCILLEKEKEAGKWESSLIRRRTSGAIRK
ncbi:uncharacterized protein V6R79_015466 [Siganus canaliculatus]